MGVATDVGRRLVEAAEHLTGREVAPEGTLELTESLQSDNRILRKTLEFVGFKLFNFQAGQPHEMKPQARKLTVQKALTAFAEDPMAGNYVDLYVSFVFGRGVPRPQAFDADVQRHLDDTWDDEANKRILTSFEKLIEKGIDFNIQSSIFFLFFDDGEDGMVRLSLLRYLDVEGVRRHPIDRIRILFYKVLEYPAQAYDWGKGAETIPNPASEQVKRVYYEAIGAFDEDNPVMVEQDRRAEGQSLTPPEALKRPGRVYQLATNKTSEDAFGIPVMRRLMRWWTVHNEVLEAHHNRMKAMAEIYMKATVKGNERDLERLGQMATGRRSAFGSSQTGDGPAVAPAPRGPGILGQNEGLNYEPFKIDSGATDVAQSVPQIRAQFSGPWPATYFGQEAGALAGAQSVELPVLKFVEREQELWLGLFRAFADLSIEKAIEKGKITEWRDPTDEEQARIEAADKAGEDLGELEVNDEGQVKRDLGYELSLPSPLKRAMADLVTSAIEIATAVDPNGENPELSRWLFAFCLAEAFDVQDPMRIVDQVLPKHAIAEKQTSDVVVDPESGEPIDPMTGEPLAGAVGPDGKRHPADNPYGAPRKSPNPEQRPLAEALHGVRRRGSSRRAVRRGREVAQAFDEDVARIAKQHLARISHLTAMNGDGPH